MKNCRVHPTHWLISTQVTRLALDLVLDSIDATCKQLAGLSPLKDLSPMRHAAESSAPALFMQARSDRIIALKHVEALANRYGGSRKLAIVDGTHSSPPAWKSTSASGALSRRRRGRAGSVER